MIIYIKSTINSQDVYSKYSGMILQTILDLLAAAGHTGVEEITEEVYATFQNHRP